MPKVRLCPSIISSKTKNDNKRGERQRRTQTQTSASAARVNFGRKRALWRHGRAMCTHVPRSMWLALTQSQGPFSLCACLFICVPLCDVRFAVVLSRILGACVCAEPKRARDRPHCAQSSSSSSSSSPSFSNSLPPPSSHNFLTSDGIAVLCHLYGDAGASGTAQRDDVHVTSGLLVRP